MQNNFRWEFFETPPGKGLYKEWSQLCESDSHSCAASYPVFSHASRYLLNDFRIIYAFSFVDDKMVCAIPLFIKSKKICLFLCKVLQIVNHNHLDVYVIPGQDLWKADELINSLILAMNRQLKGWDYFQGRNLLFKDYISSNNLLPFYQNQSAYFNLSDVDSLNQIISKKLLKNINRLQKKITINDQTLDLKCIESCGGVSEALEVFVGLEGAGWKGKSNTSIGSQEEVHEFYKEVWGEFSVIGKAQIYLLYLNDDPVAGALAIKHADTVYLHKIAYSELLTEYGPGSILVKLIIEKVLSESTASTVCLNTNPNWAKRWHPDVHDLMAIECFNSTFKGLMLKIIFSLHRTVKRLKIRIKNIKALNK